MTRTFVRLRCSCLRADVVALRGRVRDGDDAAIGKTLRHPQRERAPATAELQDAHAPAQCLRARKSLRAPRVRRAARSLTAVGPPAAAVFAMRSEHMREEFRGHFVVLLVRLVRDRGNRRAVHRCDECLRRTRRALRSRDVRASAVDRAAACECPLRITASGSSPCSVQSMASSTAAFIAASWLSVRHSADKSLHAASQCSAPSATAPAAADRIAMTARRSGRRRTRVAPPRTQSAGRCSRSDLARAAPSSMKSRWRRSWACRQASGSSLSGVLAPSST